jgi:hypothetical protein
MYKTGVTIQIAKPSSVGKIVEWLKGITFMGISVKNREELFSCLLMTRECVKFAENDAEDGPRKTIVSMWKLDGAQKTGHVHSSFVVMLLAPEQVPKLVVRLGDRVEGSSRSDGSGSSIGSSGGVTVDLGLRAVPRDVAGLAATVAGLTRGVQRAAVGSGAVAGDVACQTLVATPSLSSPMHSPSFPQA